MKIPIIKIILIFLASGMSCFGAAAEDMAVRYFAALKAGDHAAVSNLVSDSAKKQVVDKIAAIMPFIAVKKDGASARLQQEIFGNKTYKNFTRNEIFELLIKAAIRRDPSLKDIDVSVIGSVADQDRGGNIRYVIYRAKEGQQYFPALIQLIPRGDDEGIFDDITLWHLMDIIIQELNKQ